MAFRPLCYIAGLALFGLLPLCAADGPQTQTTSGPSADQSISMVLPTLAEMRAMPASQLDEMGDQFRRVRDYLSALDCYREAIRKQASASYYNKIAISELMLKHPSEAAKAARKALHKNKNFEEAWNNLGVSFYMRRKFENAIRSYERAISINPDFASYHNNLAATLMDTNQYELGLAEYRKAFELDNSFFEHTSQNGINAHMPPKDRAEFSFVMARLFATTGDVDRTLHFLRSAMEDGYPKIDDVYRDKDFAQVRNDQRFLALMKERPVSVR
jgi:tetratricopeptide (TPR) repeat protein